MYAIYKPGDYWCHDTAPTREAAESKLANLPAGYKFAQYEAWEELHKLEAMASFPLSEITEEFYLEQLGCLPPIYRAGAMGFFCCEALTMTIRAQFVEYHGRYYGAYVDGANRETWITPEKIAALPDGAAPLSWFPPRKESAS